MRLRNGARGDGNYRNAVDTTNALLSSRQLLLWQAARPLSSGVATISP